MTTVGELRDRARFAGDAPDPEELKVVVVLLPASVRVGLYRRAHRAGVQMGEYVRLLVERDLDVPPSEGDAVARLWAEWRANDA